MNELLQRAAALELTPADIDEIAQSAHAALRALERCQGNYARGEWYLLPLTEKNEVREKVLDRLESQAAGGPETAGMFNGRGQRMFAAIVGALDPRR